MSGVSVQLGARVVIDPSFGVGVAAWRSKLPNPGAIKMTNRSTLLLKGDLSGLTIEDLDLDGTLVVTCVPGATVSLKRVRVSNSGWSFVSLGWGGKAEEALAIRGYQLSQSAQRELNFEKPGEYVVEDEESVSIGVSLMKRCVVS